MMHYIDRVKVAALDYARDLTERGYTDITVWRYETPLDNREPYYRNHQAAFGYAVRYTSSEAIDSDVYAHLNKSWPGGKPPKFHDRSVTVFTDDTQLSQARLVSNGILADFAGEDVTPMFVSHWSPNEDTPGVLPENIPPIPTVGMKRFDTRATENSYPFQIGPRKYYHLIMTAQEGISR